MKVDETFTSQLTDPEYFILTWNMFYSLNESLSYSVIVLSKPTTYLTLNIHM